MTQRRTAKGERFLARYGAEGAEKMLEDPEVRAIVARFRERNPGDLRTDAQIVRIYAHNLALHPRRSPS